MESESDFSQAKREVIKNDFLRLLNEKSYSQLSMKGLAELSGMSRQNLYRYYSSKDEILEEILQDSFDKISTSLEVVSKEMTPEMWSLFVQRCYEIIFQHRYQVSSLLSGGADKLVYRYTKSFVVRLLGHMARINNIVIKDPEFFDLIVHHLTGSSFHVIKAWAKGGMSVPVEQMAKIHYRLVDEAILDLIREAQ